jgi:hypothetical protein
MANKPQVQQSKSKAGLKANGKGKKKNSDDEEAYEDKKSKKQMQKDKDPNRPKRPQSGYFHYMNDRREASKNDAEKLSMTD